MIKFLRKKSNQRKILIALVVLIVPGFLFWGIVMDSGGGRGAAGTFDTKKIGVNEFIKNFEALRREMELFQGINFNQAASSLNLEMMTWQRIVMLRAAREAGVRVENREVVDWITSRPFFQRDGRFERSLYNTILERYLRTDARGFEENTRDFLTIVAWREKVISGINVGEEDVRYQFDKRFSPRDIRYVIFAEEDVAAEQPEVTEEEIQKIYETAGAALVSPPQARARFIQREESAAEPSPEELTALLEKDGSDTGLFGPEDPIAGVGLSREISAGIFALSKPEERTAWIPFEGRLYLFELTERRPSVPLSLEEARPMIAEDLAKRRLLQKTAELARAFKADTVVATFEEAAKKHGRTILEAKGYVFGNYLEKIGELRHVDRLIEELGTGEISRPVQTSNGFALIEVLAVGEPDETLWEENREGLLEEIRQKRESETLQGELNKLAARLKINPDTMKQLFPAKDKDGQTETTPPSES